ncbi:hypothetical protein [Micromonospora sp. NPDC048947]|uniref:hypothetical protein n=1 Tax=Micromonospora sp. NPDC048947 TaxID=3154826 RepID=UPI003401BCE5
MPDVTLREASLRLLAWDRDYLWRIGEACIGRPDATTLPLLSTLQHLALINYEGRRFLQQEDPGQLPHIPQLEAEAAAAARHANKLFLDTSGYLDGVIRHYAAIAGQHHRVFFPADRPLGSLFDGFRRDLGVLRYRGHLIATTHTIHFNCGLPSEAFGSLDRMGPRLGAMAEGFGNFARVDIAASADARNYWLDALNENDFSFSNVKSHRFYGAAFSGDVEPDLVAALLSLQVACATVDLLTGQATRLPDGTWPIPVLKLRYVTLYQVLDSLRHLTQTRGTVLPALLLQQPSAELVLSGSGRKLRNTLVHYGLRINGVSVLPGQRPLFGIVEYLLDGMTYGELNTLVDGLLRDACDLLRQWSRIQ